MFKIFENAETRLNDMCEGSIYFDDIDQLEDIGELPGIKSGSYQPVMFKPLCGLFNQSKYLPLRNMPFETELELSDNDAPIGTTFNNLYTAANTSVSWRIRNYQIKRAVLSLDNSLDNACVNHVLGSNTLKLIYDTYISSLQTITSADTQVNVSRSLTALRSVFMSLYKTFTEARIQWCNKSWSTFYSTMIGNRDGPSNIKDSENEIQHSQLMRGSKMYPAYPIRSHAESFYNLRKSLGVEANSLLAVDIKGNEYRNHKFVVGFDTEQMLGLAFTGVNTTKSLLTIKFETNRGDYQASRMHLVLVSQQVLEVGDNGVTIFD